MYDTPAYQIVNHLRVEFPHIAEAASSLASY